MKRAKWILLFVLSGLLFNACNDDECDCIVGEWKVDNLISVESAVYPKNDNYSPLIKFKSDGSYDVVLDVNLCLGDYSLGLNDSISISGAGCTEVCCDSQFSNKFTTMLPQVSTYTVHGDELRLSVDGWGWFNLNRISE